MIDEVNIREAHGVSCVQGADKGWTLVREQHQSIQISVHGYELSMAPDDALRLASMLRRLAKRIKERTK